MMLELFLYKVLGYLFEGSIICNNPLTFDAYIRPPVVTLEDTIPVIVPQVLLLGECSSGCVLQLKSFMDSRVDKATSVDSRLSSFLWNN